MTRLVPLIMALLVANAAAAVRAQDDDEPDEAANGQQAPMLRAVLAQQMANAEQVDQWVFGRLGGSGPARTKLDSNLKLRIDDLDRVCHMSESQKKKLLLAGRGDIKRFFDRIEEVKRKFQQGQNDPNANIWQEIQPLQVELNVGLFGDDSIYYKTIRRTLEDEQISRYASLARARKLTRYRATIEWFVVHLDKGLGMTDDQRERFVELLLNETRPPKKFSQGDYWYLMLQTARVPEAKSKALFDVPQWRILRRQFDQARGMEQWLERMGAVPDDETADLTPPAAAVRTAPLANAPGLDNVKKPAGPK